MKATSGSVSQSVSRLILVSLCVVNVLRFSFLVSRLGTECCLMLSQFCSINNRSFSCSDSAHTSVSFLSHGGSSAFGPSLLPARNTCSSHHRLTSSPLVSPCLNTKELDFFFTFQNTFRLIRLNSFRNSHASLRWSSHVSLKTLRKGRSPEQSTLRSFRPI